MLIVLGIVVFKVWIIEDGKVFRLYGLVCVDVVCVSGDDFWLFGNWLFILKRFIVVLYLFMYGCSIEEIVF